VLVVEVKLGAWASLPHRVGGDEAVKAAAEVMRVRQAKVDRYRALVATGDLSKQELQDAEIEYAIAKRDWVAARERNVDSAPAADPALLRAEADRAHADENFALYRRSLLTIAAPASGTVSRLRVRAGDDVFTRDTLAEIVDASSVRVQASIAPELVRYIRPGASVDVKLLTVPPRTFREPVARVTPASRDGGPMLVVNVPNPDRLLTPGTPALITIQ